MCRVGVRAESQEAHKRASGWPSGPCTHIIRVPCFPANVVGHPPCLGHGLALVHLELRVADDLLHLCVLTEGVLLQALGELHVLEGQVRGALEAALAAVVWSVWWRERVCEGQGALGPACSLQPALRRSPGGPPACLLAGAQGPAHTRQSLQWRRGMSGQRQQGAH